MHTVYNLETYNCVALRDEMLALDIPQNSLRRLARAQVKAKASSGAAAAAAASAAADINSCKSALRSHERHK